MLCGLYCVTQMEKRSVDRMVLFGLNDMGVRTKRQKNIGIGSKLTFHINGKFGLISPKCTISFPSPQMVSNLTN